MSTQPQSHPQYPQRIGEQVCRDFLRTGRCKYGESCKYNHPPNVQSGGGIRSPLDPNEPPFPIRPNEPPCQYYLKHGTCKFGQTCKFHHPTHIMSTGGGALSGTVLMNIVGSSQGGTGQQLIALNDGTGVGELQQVVQLLPQRPGEPDCIYFPRNGRCKYGATCNYHHPLTNTGSSHQQRPQEPRTAPRTHLRPITQCRERQVFVELVARNVRVAYRYLVRTLPVRHIFSIWARALRGAACTYQMPELSWSFSHHHHEHTQKFESIHWGR